MRVTITNACATIGTLSITGVQIEIVGVIVKAPPDPSEPPEEPDEPEDVEPGTEGQPPR